MLRLLPIFELLAFDFRLARQRDEEYLLGFQKLLDGNGDYLPDSSGEVDKIKNLR